MRISLIGVLFMVACGSSGNHAPDAGDPTGDGNQGTGCGGLRGGQCAADQYCDFPANTCGAADESGTCKPRPQACPAVVGPPTCGCDGMVHPGDCASYSVGADLNANGGCPLQPNTFACGYLQCDLRTQYCRREIVRAGVVDYSCPILPTGCGATPDCTCLRAERCASMCTGEAKGGLTVTCN